MRPGNPFSSYHPIINVIYFGLVLMFSMCFMHPVCLGVSFASALIYTMDLRKRLAAHRSLWFMVPMMLLAALINPAFNHEGGTILCYLPSGNPLTLESIAYGAAAAVMLATVLLWFGCYHEIMTSDKFMYLFGRIIPALSLVLSMTLRFVPKYKAQIKVVSGARRCMGCDASDESIIRRLRSAATILSILVTWSLENAIETADSMKSRGYGLPGRTAFSVYRFDDRDKATLVWLLLCGSYVIFGWICGGFSFRYYPTIKGIELGPLPLSFLLAYLALCLTPVIINSKEDRRWNYIASAT